jgi:hypothetical protein
MVKIGEHHWKRKIQNTFGVEMIKYSIVKSHPLLTDAFIRSMSVLYNDNDQTVKSNINMSFNDTQLFVMPLSSISINHIFEQSNIRYIDLKYGLNSVGEPKECIYNPRMYNCKFNKEHIQHGMIINLDCNYNDFMVYKFPRQILINVIPMHTTEELDKQHRLGKKINIVPFQYGIYEEPTIETKFEFIWQ